MNLINMHKWRTIVSCIYNELGIYQEGLLSQYEKACKAGNAIKAEKLINQMESKYTDDDWTEEDITPTSMPCVGLLPAIHGCGN
ncbi:MAG: hypothetical protein ACI30A_05835 [Paludibacteraceae bacterium]